MRNREKSILLRLTPKELDEINRKAKAAQLSREAFCRMALNGVQIKEAPPAEFYSLITEVRKVGVHLNQILRKANSIGLLDVPLIKKSLEELYATEDMLWNTFEHKEK